MKSPLCDALRAAHRILWVLFLAAGLARAQSGSVDPGSGSQVELAQKIDQLTRSLEQTQGELAQSRAEIQQLRTSLQEILKRMDSLTPVSAGLGAQENKGTASQLAPQPQPGESRPMAQISQDDWDILNARVDEQRQTKVESVSKFRLKLSGIALFNAFATFGQTDNIDVPAIAVSKTPGYSEGNVGASVRQSILGLTGIGPTVLGARSNADLQMDFFGGLPAGYGANTSGLVEVRLARIRFDWKNSAVVAGLDYPFFSPNLPTSYMSVVVPAFASAGNLWTWTPTIRVEHRFEGAFSPFKVEAGFLDPASYSNYGPNTNVRTPSPTESSRQPTYAMRLSASTKSEDRPASIGASGVYSPQRYFGGYRVAGWAGTVDWRFPLLPRTELSGQFFTGRGIDGFGGLPLSPLRPPDAQQYANITAPTLANLGVIGGWSQFKIKVDSRNEFNVAAGTGGRNSAGLRSAAVWDAFLQTVPARNQILFVNYIFRPRSDLVFSAEYRRLRTYEVTGAPDSAGQLGLALGFLF